MAYDPLRKIEVPDTPEEGVRQWIIRYLLDAASVPVSLMNSEVGFRFGRKLFRADVLVFGRDGSPLAVVECKRPEVVIDEQVCRQALRYDAVLSVKVIILTNGRKTYVFRRNACGTEFVRMEKFPTYEEMLLCQP